MARWQNPVRALALVSNMFEVMRLFIIKFLITIVFHIKVTFIAEYLLGEQAVNALLKWIMDHYPTNVAQVVVGAIDPWFTSVQPSLVAPAATQVANNLLGLPTTFVTGSVSGSGEADIVNGLTPIVQGIINLYSLNALTPEIGTVLKNAAAFVVTRYSGSAIY
jgi:hypothetical protein